MRSDNGPEFICGKLQDWMREHGIEPIYIESFNGKLRDERGNTELFWSAWEAQVIVNEWRHTYNWERPHSSLGFTPPAQAALLGLGPRLSLSLSLS